MMSPLMIEQNREFCMKYFKDGDILLSDFDGVYLDSQKEFLKVMKEEKSLELWMNYLNTIDWKKFLMECDEIPDANRTFLELQELKILRGFITRIHSFDEGFYKGNFLREKGLYVPIYYVLPKQEKSSVYLPNEHIILLEDNYHNASDWENHGGRSLIYDPNGKEDEKVVKRLTYLLH